MKGQRPAVRDLARAGEDAVARHLEKRGYRIVARNLRIGRGEIDIVARKSNLVCIVEVKTRRITSHGEGLEAVTQRKKDQLRKLGRLLASREPHLMYRWDVASVGFDDDDAPVVTYVQNAFTETDG